MKTKTWPFGYEEPLTETDFSRFTPKPTAFFSCGMLSQFGDVYVPLIRHAASMLLKFFKCVLKSSFAEVDKYYPGNILSAVWVKS